MGAALKRQKKKNDHAGYFHKASHIKLKKKKKLTRPGKLHEGFAITFCLQYPQSWVNSFLLDVLKYLEIPVPTRKWCFLFTWKDFQEFCGKTIFLRVFMTLWIL